MSLYAFTDIFYDYKKKSKEDQRRGIFLSCLSVKLVDVLRISSSFHNFFSCLHTLMTSNTHMTRDIIGRGRPKMELVKVTWTLLLSNGWKDTINIFPPFTSLSFHMIWIIWDEWMTAFISNLLCCYQTNTKYSKTTPL